MGWDHKLLLELCTTCTAAPNWIGPVAHLLQSASSQQHSNSRQGEGRLRVRGNNWCFHFKSRRADAPRWWLACHCHQRSSEMCFWLISMRLLGKCWLWLMFSQCFPRSIPSNRGDCIIHAFLKQPLLWSSRSFHSVLRHKRDTHTHTPKQCV